MKKRKNTNEQWDLEEIPYETNDPAGGWYLHFDKRGSDYALPLYISKANLSDERAERIAPCVNGCKGIVDPEITVSELLAALENILDQIEGSAVCRDARLYVARGQAALAKAKG